MAKKKNTKNSTISDIPESYQRYLDEIHTISRRKKGGWVTNKEIADKLEVKPSSVTGMLKKLKEKDLIKWSKRKTIRLTEQGKRFAKQLNEIHNLLHLFFANVLKIKDKKVIEDLSCEIEHHITRDVKDSLEEFLTNYLDL